MAESPVVIPFNDFSRMWTETRAQIHEALDSVGAAGMYILGSHVSDFEAKLASFWSLNRCIGVANGMDAIEIGLRVLGLQPGQKVLTTPLSAFATTLAIIRAGGVPVFPDVDESGLVDLVQVKAILENDPAIRFFVPVHLFGFCLDLDQLRTLKSDYSLQIVEDCAQSIGASWKNQKCGSVGQVAATSFYPTKNLGCLGDGGALLTSDLDMAARAVRLRNYGQSKKYEHTEIGLNSRLDEVQASLLAKVFLPRLEVQTQRRREIGQLYLQGIRNQRLRLPQPARESDSVWHLFPVFTNVAKDRDRLVEFLKNRGVGTAIHYPIPIHKQKPILHSGSLPISERLSSTEVSLPLHPYLKDNEIHQIISAVNQFNG